MKGIRLSRKHGVNPSLLQCFGCLKEYGVALVGALPGDQEAPRIMRTGEMCDVCLGYMKKGVILISVDESKTTDQKNPHRSGGWVVVTDDAIRRVIQNHEMRDFVLKRRLAFVPDEVWDLIGLPR